MWFEEMVDFGSRIKGLGTNTNLGKSTLGLRVGFGSRVVSKSKYWNSHSFSINGMWLSKIGGSIPRSMGIGISIGSKNGSKLGKDTGVNIDLKTEIESQSCELGSHSQSSSIFLKWKLANSLKVWDCQVQVGVRKLNLG